MTLVSPLRVMASRLARKPLLRKVFAPVLAAAPVLWLYIAMPTTVSAKTDSPELSAAWLKLLHMKPDGNARWKSEVVSPGFFLSPSGRMNPAAEWDATVKSFTQPFDGPPDSNPQCMFPARFQLVMQLTGKPLHKAACPSLDRWNADLGARSVTVVHAAQYVRNPASIFGHLFLRFDVAEPNEYDLRLDTLAHSVGFFAQMPPDVGAYDYVVKGLGGGFEGHFIFSSYARSLVEYNQMEDRDLWEYELELTPEEIAQITNHLWEMQRFGVFDYFFLRENCAYQLLALVEAAVPRWDLTSHFQIYVIPSDSLRALQDAGALRQVRYRPSLGTNLRKSVRSLSSNQQRQLSDVIDGAVSARSVSDAAVLDAAIDLLDYRTHQAKGDVPANFIEIKRAVLEQRSHMPSAPKTERTTGRPPHLGHGPAKISFGYLSDAEDAGFTLGWRPAMHRNTDGPGYPPGFSLEILDLKAIVEPATHKAFWHQITLLSVENLREFEAVDQGPAWHLQIGWERSIFQSDDTRSMIFAVNPAVGLATSPERALQVFALLSAPIETATNEVEAGLGLIVGSVMSIANQISSRLEFRIDRLTIPRPSIRRKLSGNLEYHLARDWSLQGRTEVTNARRNYEVGLSWFF